MMITQPSIPNSLFLAAQEYAHRRSRRECRVVYVYSKGGIVYVRGSGEPRPEGSEIIYRTDGGPLS
jgi:hypothetical protein